MSRTRALLPVLALLPMLAACTSTGGAYPSLAKREAEKALPTAIEAPEAPPPPVASASLESRISGLVGEAREAHRTFRARSDAARRAVTVSGAASPGSEAWTDAQVAISSLEGARSAAMVSLAELDSLYAGARLAYDAAESPEAARIGSARDEVEVMVAEQSQLITQLLRRVGG